MYSRQRVTQNHGNLTPRKNNNPRGQQIISETQIKYSVIVLAGDRGPGDPVAKAQGASCKALASLFDRPLLLRVLDILLTSPYVRNILIVGPKMNHRDSNPELMSLINNNQVKWLEPDRTPCTSALLALSDSSIQYPVLLTTADHAFLSHAIIEEFVLTASESSADILAGLVSHERVMKRFPHAKRTALKFSDGAFCSCNLFAIHRAQGQIAVQYWRRVEQLRKKPWRIASLIGWRTLVSFVFKRLSIAKVMAQLTQVTGAHVSFVELQNADAAVDIDSQEDWRMANKILTQRS